jgi:hypothetical protein
MIIAALGKTLHDDTWDAENGHVDRTVTYFLDYVYGRFGVTTADTFDRIKACIATLLGSEDDFESFCALLKGYFARLVQLGQPRSEYDKLDNF